MLRKLNEWLDLQPAIRICVASVEIGLDPRIMTLMKRLGLRGMPG